MSDVGLDENCPLRVETELLESIERDGEISRVYCISQSVLVVPFPRQGNSTVDPVVRRLSSLPILVRVLTIPSERTRLY